AEISSVHDHTHPPLHASEADATAVHALAGAISIRDRGVDVGTNRCARTSVQRGGASASLLVGMTGMATPVVDLATPADAELWDRFVDGHPDASGYHVWAWRRVFKQALGHDSFYLVARDQTGVVGALPLVHIKSSIFGRTLTSLAFLNYGGMVA